MATRSNAEKFVTFRARAKDVLRTSGPDVERNAMRNMGLGVMAEYDWMVQAIELLTKGDPKKLNDLQLALHGEKTDSTSESA